jgi:hypothetical protein
MNSFFSAKADMSSKLETLTVLPWFAGPVPQTG